MTPFMAWARTADVQLNSVDGYRYTLETHRPPADVGYWLWRNLEVEARRWARLGWQVHP